MCRIEKRIDYNSVGQLSVIQNTVLCRRSQNRKPCSDTTRPISNVFPETATRRCETSSSAGSLNTQSSRKNQETEHVQHQRASLDFEDFVTSPPSSTPSGETEVVGGTSRTTSVVRSIWQRISLQKKLYARPLSTASLPAKRLWMSLPSLRTDGPAMVSIVGSYNFFLHSLQTCAENSRKGLDRAKDILEAGLVAMGYAEPPLKAGYTRLEWQCVSVPQPDLIKHTVNDIDAQDQWLNKHRNVVKRSSEMFLSISKVVSTS